MKRNTQPFAHEMLTDKDGDMFCLVKEGCHFLDHGNAFVNVGNVAWPECAGGALGRNV